jgi:hypothetical protein
MRLLALLGTVTVAVLLTTTMLAQKSTPSEGTNEELSAAPHAVTLSNEQIKEMIREVAEKDIENDKRQREYTYIQREVENKLDGKGMVKSTEIKTYEVMVLYDEQVKRLIAKDDEPLVEKDAAKEEEKLQKIIEKHKNESEDDRRKRLAKKDKEREEGRQFVAEVADAYNFRLVGVEQLQGRDTYAIDAEPRPGYEARRKEAKILPKFRFRIWIDASAKQWVKLDAQCIDTVSFGLIIARLHKGSRILIDQTRVNDEVWLPRHVAVKIDAKVALLKNLDVAMDVTFRDYKKFGAVSKIVGVSEIDETK